MESHEPSRGQGTGRKLAITTASLSLEPGITLGSQWRILGAHTQLLRSSSSAGHSHLSIIAFLMTSVLPLTSSLITDEQQQNAWERLGGKREPTTVTFTFHPDMLSLEVPSRVFLVGLQHPPSSTQSYSHLGT